MSRRKQAKPRSLKYDPDMSENNPRAPTPSSTPNSPNSTYHSDTTSPESEEGETSASETASEAVDSDLGYSVGVTDTTPYQCQFCNKAFPRLGYLKKHEQSHSEHMPFRCDYCRRLFKHKRSRDRHVKLHTGDKKYRCSQCVAAFSRSDHLKIHMKTHDNQKPYQCNFCNRGYNTAAALTSHLQSHKREIIANSIAYNNLCCLQCNIAFPSIQEYSVHISNKVLHREKTPEAGDVSFRPSTSCSKCSKNKFSTEEDFKKHMKSCRGGERGHSSEFCRENSQEDNLAREHLKCPICSESYPSLKSLSTHISLSHGGSQIQIDSNTSCKKCMIQFPNSRLMIEHWLYYHGVNNSSSSFPQDQTAPTDLSILKNEEVPPKKKTRYKEAESPIITKAEVHYDPGTLLCNQCNAALPDFESFRNHLKSHLEESSNSSKQAKKMRYGMCSYCRVPISSMQEMVKHIGTHILTTVTEYFCNICQKAFQASADLEQHLIQVHSHHLYLCYACKELFDTRFAIQRHFLLKHINESTKYACRLCQTSPPLKSEIEFELHVRNFHCGFDSSITFQDVSLQCAYCNEMSKSRSELENHMKLHCQSSVNFGKHKCNICDEICQTATSLAEHKLTHCKVIYGSTCSDCKASITNEENFINHMINHNNGLSGKAFQLTLPVSCVICRQTLVSEAEARLHAKFHLQLETRQCTICLQDFNKFDLRENVCIKCLEENSSPRQCPQCEMNFQTSTELENHVSEEHKMLKCDNCKAFFGSKEDYDLHLKAFCSTDDSQRLKCNICLMVLPSQNKLQAHLIEHTFTGYANYTCYICGAVFTISSGLQKHITEHGSSLKPYGCTKCNMKFFFRAELDNHLFLHQMNYRMTKVANSSEETKKCAIPEVQKTDNDKNNNEENTKENDGKNESKHA